MTTIDVDAYLERIAYKGSLTPSLENLAKIQLLHTQAIPFENIDPFLGLPVLLDLPSLEDKLVKRKRGGYCFEQNLLLRESRVAHTFCLHLYCLQHPYRAGIPVLPASRRNSDHRRPIYPHGFLDAIIIL